MKFNKDLLAAAIPIAFFVLFFGCIIVSIFGDFIMHFDIAPASGTTTGYISFQEKSGIYGLDQVCWRDTPYSECETFDPVGKTYDPGKYKMTYECTRFVWAWEHANECHIVNATKIGEIPAN